jgi:hypothetical protein
MSDQDEDMLEGMAKVLLRAGYAVSRPTGGVIALSPPPPPPPPPPAQWEGTMGFTINDSRATADYVLEFISRALGVAKPDVAQFMQMGFIGIRVRPSAGKLLPGIDVEVYFTLAERPKGARGKRYAFTADLERDLTEAHKAAQTPPLPLSRLGHLTGYSPTDVIIDDPILRGRMDALKRESDERMRALIDHMQKLPSGPGQSGGGGGLWEYWKNRKFPK